MFNQNYSLSVPVNENDHAQGSPNAPITIVEYGDYQCPHCGRAYPIMKQLQKDFGKQLRFVFRNFPLTEMHEHAFKAAEATEIAADANKFWEMHDTLFEHQEQLDDLHLIKFAHQLGLNEKDFISNMKNQSKADKVQSDFMSGVESGVNGTPSFFINGYKYDGDWEYESFKSVLTNLVTNK